MVEKLCPDCNLPMNESYFSSRGYWGVGKSKIKLSVNRDFVNVKLKNVQSWICEGCHLILFRY